MELYEPSNVSDFIFVLILISLTIIGVLKSFTINIPIYTILVFLLKDILINI